MAALTITAANVQLGDSSVTTSTVQAGEVITHGEAVYKKTSDKKYYLAANNSTEEVAKAAGVALTPAKAIDDYFIIATAGNVDVGATVTVGETYYVGTTGGTIEPVGDLGTGERITKIGIGTVADNLNIKIDASGIAKP